MHVGAGSLSRYDGNSKKKKSRQMGQWDACKPQTPLLDSAAPPVNKTQLAIIEIWRHAGVKFIGPNGGRGEGGRIEFQSKSNSGSRREDGAFSPGVKYACAFAFVGPRNELPGQGGCFLFISRPAT